ncbi:MAG: DUF503 domain-containing protein [Deltaproteobacteria bacterium]|nr:DUF503 domain-containing protein [Deltaproteobacteria bacterium]
MYVGFLEVTISMEGNRSLKDKRKVVKSILSRVRAKFNASAAEVDLADVHGSAVLGFSICGGDASLLSSVLDHISNFIEATVAAEVVDTHAECLQVS